jgi:membrane glycosyltransferase
MWFHSKFVLITLIGRQIHWGAQRRANENGSSWLEAARAHGVSTVFAAAWITGMLWLNPAISVWVLPVAITLLFSISISVASSRLSLGRASQRLRLFCIPEEIAMVPVLAELHDALNKRQKEATSLDVFSYVILDRVANRVHIEMLRNREPKTDKTKERNRNLLEVVLESGPGTLSRSDKAGLLKDVKSVSVLHREILRRVNSDAVSQLNLGLNLKAKTKNAIAHSDFRVANPSADASGDAGT